jgi:sec-independent protein translocase protein TatA
MFGVGTQELLVILLVVLLLFGGRRLPELARTLGNGVRDFRKAVRDVQREVDLDGTLRTPPATTGSTTIQAQPGPPERRPPPSIPGEGGDGI